jgi:3-dehydroquinate synthetase
MDKKFHDGVRFVLLEDVGRPLIVDGVPPNEVRRVLHEMGAPV